LTKSHGAPAGEGGSSNTSLAGSLNSTASGALALTGSSSGSNAGGGNGGGGNHGEAGLGDLVGGAGDCLCETVKNALGGANGDGSKSSSGKPQSTSTTNPESQRTNPPGKNANTRERDMADRKDLWWPPHTQGSYRDERLNDH
jgi:hypothetical protein